MIEQIAPLLEKLAEKLGTTAEKLWAVLVGQAQLEGWFCILRCVVCIAASLAVVYKVIPMAWAYEGWNQFDEGFARTLITAFGAAGVAILVGYTVYTITLAITCFANPEYWALQQVLRQLR